MCLDILLYRIPRNTSASGSTLKVGISTVVKGVPSSFCNSTAYIGLEYEEGNLPIIMHIISKVESYCFLGCLIKLQKKGSYYTALISSENPVWALETSTPFSCPVAALMGAEEVIIRRQLAVKESPAFIFKLNKTGEIITTNTDFKKLFKGKTVTELFHNSSFQELSKVITNFKVITTIITLDSNRHLLQVKTVRSPVSLYRRAYGEIV